jgi:predicted nucleotidyltransferase
MVKIYSWEDVLAGRVATRQNLVLARRRALELLKKMHERGWIESGCIFGSAVRGDAVRGSDLDVLIISKPEKQRAVEKYLKRAYAASMDFLHVEPEVLHITTEEAKSGNHSISPTFLQNIQRAIGKSTLVGKNPAGIIRIPKNFSEMERVLVLDLLKKARTRNNRLLYLAKKGASAYYQELGYAISQTIRSARIALDIASYDGKKQKVPLQKSEILEAYRQQFPQNADAIQALQRAERALYNYHQALKKAQAAVASGNKARVQEAKADFEATLFGLQAASNSNIRMLENNLRQLWPIPARKLMTQKPVSRIDRERKIRAKPR